MRLKKLEIIGFKSFRDKVVLDFSAGISAIVGPNGCGKSNIVDALRWVMGEQRIKMLRGKKMDDVIFNGSEEAAPVGMTEVSMILAGDGQKFPGDYAGCSEVMISRRVFREGESEYYINGVPCRLLDIKEFFMGTGVGARTYSLVEQNSIASLVEAKPEERRQLIEEAAGISKYKSRKESALRKMEATKQNMVRLDDIVREVRTQLNCVSRQARRAEQYRVLKKNIKEAQLLLALQTYTELSARKELLEKSQDALKIRVTEVRTRLMEFETSLKELKAEVLEREEQISGYREKLYKIKNAISIKEQEIKFSGEKVGDISARKQRNLKEIKMHRGRWEELGSEIDTIRKMTGEMDGKIEECRITVLDSQKGIEELKNVERALYQELEEKKIEYIDLVTEKAKLKNILTGLIKGMEDLKRRGEREGGEVEEDKKRHDTVCHTLYDLRSKLRLDEETFKDLKEREALVLDEYERVRNNLRWLEERISEIKAEMDRKSSRLHSLREFQEWYEWCGEGTRTIMQAAKDGDLDGLARDAFFGLVADNIDVPREYETAVQAVLGEKLQYVVVKNEEEGAKAVDYLKRCSLGRGSFVPLKVRNHFSALASGGHAKETVRLVDKVGFHDDFKEIADYLLGDVVLIPSLDDAIYLWKKNGFRGTFVTPEGDIVTPQGVITGGSPANGERSLLRNRREQIELEKEVGRLARLLEEETEHKKKADALISRWEGELLQLRTELHRLELEINAERKDVEHLEDERKRIEQRIRVLDFNRENLKSEEGEASEKIERIEEGIISLESRERILNEAVASRQENWKALRVRLEELEGRLTKERVLLASLEEKREANIKTIARLDATRVGISQQIATRGEDVKVCDRQIEEMTKQIATGQNHLESLLTDDEKIEVILEKEKELRKERETLSEGREVEIREVKDCLDQVVREANELEVEYRQIAFQMDNLKKSVRDKYYVELDAAIAGFERLDETNIQKLRIQLEKDRQSVENFGEVNLLALGEYEQLKERYDFLTTQLSDLNASLNTLQRTIARINKISRKRFAETFVEVNRCFKDVFVRIFPGGKGELRLTDESDLLETGVDIDIQLPGKRKQSVSLLSGGEKSLAAIALIFSILLYRPTPFLILDEVDATLDDANISLFNKLVKDISANSQIILVTHNKKTMEVAENLYGVTMARQGISTVVSVNLN